MLVIGLTGGIGSGKSTAAGYFAQCGIEVIDADDIVREIFATDEHLQKQLLEHFGSDILNKEEQFDRRKLREIIFNDPLERQWLERFLHPLVRNAMQTKLKVITSAYCVMIIPLLSGVIANPLLNRILVMDTPESLQIHRASLRDQVEQVDIKAIQKIQSDRHAYLQTADDVITNDGSLESLKQQVLMLHEFYLTLV